MELLIKSLFSNEITIKDLTEDTYQISGPLIKFTVIDLDGERFDPNGDYDLESDGTKQTSIYYHHGLDETIGKSVLGKGVISKRNDSSLWVEAQLRKRDKYEREIYNLAKKGKLGWSSGTASHLAEYKMIDGVKTWVRWPLGLDASLTPTPAESTNSASVKSETVKSETVKAELKTTEEEIKMADEQTQQTQEFVTSTSFQEFGVRIEGILDTIGQQMKTFVDRLDQMPTKSKAGFVSETGGKSDKTVKSFSDFLLSVKRKDTDRLKAVYGSEYQTTKDVLESSGTSGGYAVPKEESTQILQMAVNGSEILPLVTTVPVSTASGSYPALDQTIAVTAGSGNTSASAGIETTPRQEGGVFTETTPDFTDLQWQVRSTGGYTQVSKEFSADSPLAIEVLLRSLFAIAVRNKNERNVLRGSGVNEPLGILNAPCAVAVSPDTNSVFKWVDALNMASHLKVMNPGSVRWNIHQSMLPDIGQFETTGGGGVLQADLSVPLGMRILGYQIAKTEHNPQADNSGCVSLVDWSTYLLFMREELIIDFSEHVGFLNGLDTWRFYQRNDGKPWLKNKITQADPQGSFYVSPVVYFND